MQVKWFSTASLEIKNRGSDTLLFDPFVPLFGARSKVTAADFDGYTDIFITHGHFDHIASIPLIIRRNPSARVYCTKTPYRTLLLKGVREENLRLIRPGDVFDGGGFRVRVFPSKHARLCVSSPERIMRILKTAQPLSLLYYGLESYLCRENDETVLFEVEADGKKAVVMGSLNLCDGESYPVGADLLALPYNGWQTNFYPAVWVIEKLKPKRVLLDHYDDTFPPLTMPIDLSFIRNQYPSLVTPFRPGESVEV